MKLKKLKIPYGYDPDQKPQYIEVEDVELTTNEFVEMLKAIQVITR